MVSQLPVGTVGEDQQPASPAVNATQTAGGKKLRSRREHARPRRRSRRDSPESIATAFSPSSVHYSQSAVHQEAAVSFTGWHKYVVTNARTENAAFRWRWKARTSAFPPNALGHERGAFRCLIGRVEFCVHTDCTHFCGVLSGHCGLKTSLLLLFSGTKLFKRRFCSDLQSVEYPKETAPAPNITNTMHVLFYH